MSSAEPVAVERRRVRRSRRTEPKRPWRHPAIGRAVFAGMVVLALFYAGSWMRSVNYAGKFYGALGIGLVPGDVRYVLGNPTQRTGWEGGPLTPGAPQRWFYQLPEGGKLNVFFDDAGAVKRLVCEDDGASPGACAPALGIALGTVEDSIWYALGTPTQQHYDGDVKLLGYDDVGITYGLRRLQVFKIIIAERPDRWSFVPRALRVMVP